ncbi:MAG: MerR family transcriptional regulator [Clostridiaceae bacterium]|nr:MerR family transcriptional regulator [Clostridiaceae bacterium]
MAVTQNEWVSFAEIAAKTGLPEANLRRWRKQFSAWCPSRTFGRAEKFRPEVLQVFLIISRLYGERRNREEVEEALRAEIAPVIEVKEGAPDEKPFLPHAPAMDASTILTALAPMADRYLAIMERQVIAMERGNELQARLVAAAERRLALLEYAAVETPIRLVQASERKKQGEGRPASQNVSTLRNGPKSRAEIIAEVYRLHSEGLGVRAIATAMRMTGWPTLSGRGEWGKGSVARILREKK